MLSIVLGSFPATSNRACTNPPAALYADGAETVSLRGIRAVTFDMWQTLLVDTPEQEERRRRSRIRLMHQQLLLAGYRLSPEDLERAYHAADTEIERLRRGDREVGVETQVGIVLRELGIAEPTADLLGSLVKPYTEAALFDRPIFADDAARVLRAVKAEGYMIGLISNTGRTPGRILRLLLSREGILGLFDSLAFSDEVGFRKPHPEIFLKALRDLAVQPWEALHVGDTPAADVVGAKRVGMRTCLLTRSAIAQPPAEADVVIAKLGQIPAYL